MTGGRQKCHVRTIYHLLFEDLCTEQKLKLWVCNKADPESKGPIENSVGFVKKNFFSARKITCIDDV
jgi:hypothetical protein